MVQPVSWLSRTVARLLNPPVTTARIHVKVIIENVYRIYPGDNGGEVTAVEKANLTARRELRSILISSTSTSERKLYYSPELSIFLPQDNRKTALH